MKLFPRRLAPRLILGLTLLVAISAAVSGYLSAGLLERQLIEEKKLAADQLSRSIISATWHMMRTGHKDDAYDVMHTMGEHQGVDYIRLFAKEGRVAFTTEEHGAKQIQIDALECAVCHAVEPALEDIILDQRVRFLEPREGQRRMALLTPILNEPGCSNASCHVHPEEITVLGILDVAVDLGPVDRKVATLKLREVGRAILKILLIGGFIAFFVHRFVGRPIEQLIDSTERVAGMQLDEPVEVETSSELGDLGASFDTMREHLRDARDAQQRFAQDLAEQVEARTQELASAQEQLIQSDRLASLGQMAASVAHEVNNPISAVHNLAVFLERILDENGIPEGRLPAFERHLGQIASESARAGRIVQDLLTFSRRSSPHTAPADLNAMIRHTMEIVGHRVELSRIDLLLELSASLPLVPCDNAQIEQVVMNLTLNAVEAMPDGGRLIIRSGVEEATDMAVIQVEDTGPGIPQENLTRIFDPFFSTKTGAKGAGLGLAVAYGIVDAHDGRLQVQSREDRGTVFTIRLPIHPEPPPETEPQSESENAA